MGGGRGGGHVFFLSFTLCLSFILPLLLFVSVSQMNRPIQVKPADSESRGGTVSFPFLLPPALPPSLPSSLSPFPLLSRPHKHAARAHQPHHYVSHLTGPVPRLGLTAQPGRALQSEHIMLTVIFLDGADSVFGGIIICKSRSHARAHARRARARRAASTVNCLDFQDDANFKLSAFCSVATQIVETQHKRGITRTCCSPVQFIFICKARLSPRAS